MLNHDSFSLYGGYVRTMKGDPCQVYYHSSILTNQMNQYNLIHCILTLQSQHAKYY